MSLRNFLMFLTSIFVMISCLKRKEGSEAKHHAQEGTYVVGNGIDSGSRAYVVRKKVNGIFVDSRLDSEGSPLLAGSVISVTKETDKVYSFPTLQGRRYFSEEYLPKGSADFPYMSTIGLNFRFTDISGNYSHGYQTPATLPQLIKDANTKDKRFVILYFWSVCRNSRVCEQDTEHLIDFQNRTTNAQVFSIYVDLSDSSGRSKTELEVANTVRDWRESRGLAKIPFPVLWLQGQDDNDLLDMFRCHNNEGKKRMPCAVFLDRCGLAKQVLPCPFSDRSRNKCLASFVGTALNFKDHKFRQNIQNVMANASRCSY